MNRFNHSTDNGASVLISALDQYAEAGIDPAFDADSEELDRQFAELRFAFNHE